MNQFIDRYYIGKTEDKLFNANSITREKEAIFKIIRSPQLMSLCNDTFKWIAVNIPLTQVVKHKNFDEQGDIDILIAMLTPKYENNKMIGFDTIYRSFEVKTTIISIENTAKSIKKASKFKSILGQINKLKKFGAEQIFLLEIFITQAGYSYSSHKKLPEEITKEILEKIKLIPSYCGYVFTQIEQIPGYDEEKTEVVHVVRNLKTAETLMINNGFQDLVKEIEKFNENNNSQDIEINDYIIAFCEKCKELIKVKRMGPYICKKCNKLLI